MGMKLTITSLFLIFAISATVELRDTRLQSSYEYVYGSVSKYNPKQAPRITEAVLKYSNEYGLDIKKFTDLGEWESGWNPHIISKKGAIGLYQIVPRHHGEKISLVDNGRLGRDLRKRGVGKVHRRKYFFRIGYNVQMGAMHLRYLLNLYRGDYVKAFVVYNHGFSHRLTKEHVKNEDFHECTFAKGIIAIGNNRK